MKVQISRFRVGMVVSALWIMASAAACDTISAGTDDDPSTVCDESNEACDPYNCSGDGENMLPGSDCLACHTTGNLVDDKGVDPPPLPDEDEDEDDDKIFSVAGTLFSDILGSDGVQGGTVRITGADGGVLELDTYRSGNFFSTQSLSFPITAEVEVDGEVLAMFQEVSTGACSSCHQCDGSAGGKLYGP
jgi:hypothetical protein